MALRNSFLIASTIGFVWLIFLESIQSAPATSGDIGTGAYHAGVIGNYAGLLSGGEALNYLYYKMNNDKEAEPHDFSEGAAKNNPSLYESLGSLGDHLEGDEFPHDYGVEGADDDKQTEYEEKAESQAAASERFEEQGGHANFDHGHELPAHEHEHEINFGVDLYSHDAFDDFYSKPVPGIDHGKGAYSYSSTYEFKDPKP